VLPEALESNLERLATRRQRVDVHDLEAVRGDDDVLVRVRDYGSWRQPRGQNRGRGLKLMETLMDEVNVRREQTGTTVELRRTLRPESDAR